MACPLCGSTNTEQRDEGGRTVVLCCASECGHAWPLVAGVESFVRALEVSDQGVAKDRA